MISILLMFFGGISGVSAANAAEVTVNQISGNPGQAVVASISVTPDSGFGAGKFVASFDPAQLEYTGYSMGNALSDHEKSSGGLLDVNGNTAGEGKITFVYISTEDVKEGGSLLNLKFKIKEPGATTVNVEVPEFVNNQGKSIGVTVSQMAATTGENGVAQQSERADSSVVNSSDTTVTPNNEMKNGETVALLQYEEFQGLDSTQPIIWTTSDPKLAEVDATGTVIATGNGKVTITGTQGDKAVSYDMNIVGEAAKKTEAKTNANITAILIIVVILVIIALGALAFLKVKKNRRKISN